jgi:predicted permease
VLRPLFLRPQDFENRRQRLLTLVARIPSTVPLPDAQARLNATAERLMSDYPGATGRGSNRPFDRVAIAPLAEVLTYQSRTTFTLAFTAVLVLLLLAALNLAGLAAARAEDRLHHVALRRALGAGAWTLTRLQLVESLILAAGGTFVGFALAPMLLETTLRLLPETMTLVKAPEIDVRVLGFAALAAFVVAAGVSIWPAVIAVRSGLGPVMAQESSRSTRAGWLGRRAIVAAQVAVAFALAVGGTLMIGSLIAVWQEDPGYRRADVVTVEAELTGDEALRRERLVELGNVVRRVPGVADVTVLGGTILRNTFRADVGWIPPDGAEDGCLAGPKPSVDERVVDVLGLTVRAGRPIGREDIEAGRLVSVVSRQTAAKCWPGEEAVGKTFVLDDRTFTVVGVVDDARLMTLDTEPQGQTYFPHGVLSLDYGAVIAARTTRGADAALPALATTLRESEFAPEIVRVATMDTALAESVRPRRLTAWLFGGFGLSALVIVGVGVLGLVAMTAARRTREIGIRCALGASSNGIVRLLVREQLLSVTIGLVAGALATLWAVRFVESYSYGLTTASPVVWAAAAAVLLLVAATGAIVPALRASRVNPVDALRAGSGLA